MPAAITDKLTNASNGSRPISTTVQTLRAPSATSLICVDLTGWATDTAVHFVTYKIDGQSKVIVGSQSDWKGIVSGSTINNLTLTGGADNGNAVGDIVEILPTARWEKDLTDALRTSLNQDGTIKTTVITSILSQVYPVGSLYTNTSNSSNPSTYLGFGTWVAFGTGRVVVGIDAGQTEFNTIGLTGGTKTVDSSHTHQHYLSVGQSSGQVVAIRPDSIPGSGGASVVTETLGTLQSAAAGAVEQWKASTLTGGSTTLPVLQPYVTVYMWNRTA